MQKRKTASVTELQGAKSGSIDEACTRYGLGRDSMYRIAKEASAVIHIGKRFLVNFSRVDAYMDDISE